MDTRIRPGLTPRIGQVSPKTQKTALALASLVPLMAQGVLAQDSADAVARELSNPATSLASLSNKLEFRTFGGDRPDAGDQTGFRYIFQPVLPFALESGDKIIFRPAFNIPIDEPFPDGSGFGSGGGFGDIGFDIAYAPRTEGRFSYGVGLVGGVPTGTNEDLRSNNWTLGPEAFGAWIDDWGLVGGFVTHATNIAGNGADTNLTSIQYFYFLSLGDGWQLGAGPTATYNWEADSGDRWNGPVGIGLAKTTTIGGLPVKINAEIDYSVVREDAFGPEWLLKFSITPVIANPFD